jgi:hypothetical protein
MSPSQGCMTHQRQGWTPLSTDLGMVLRALLLPLFSPDKQPAAVCCMDVCCMAYPHWIIPTVKTIDEDACVPQVGLNATRMAGPNVVLRQVPCKAA